MAVLPVQEFLMNAAQFDTLCAKLDALTLAAQNISISVTNPPVDLAGIVQALQDLQSSRVTIITDKENIFAMGVQTQIEGGL